MGRIFLSEEQKFYLKVENQLVFSKFEGHSGLPNAKIRPPCLVFIDSVGVESRGATKHDEPVLVHTEMLAQLNMIFPRMEW